MSVTITANGLTISHKGSGGYARNSTPDVCKTPGKGVPVPYSIISFTRDLADGSTSVLADGNHSIAIKGSVHARCSGDEAGSMKGVASGTNLSKSSWITYSPNILVEGRNICRKTDKLFMNNGNCISGAGGEYEVPLSITDPVMAELCRIFCEARDEWHKCKSAGKSGCRRPSLLAQDKVQARLDKPGSALNKAVSRRFPGAVGHAEKTFYGFADKVFDGARKIYDESALRAALKRRLDALIKRKVVQRGAKLAAKAWMKIVPGLNIVSTIADGVGIAMDAKEIYDMVKGSDLLFDKAIKVKPDFAVPGADGSLQQIYDFKFDDPDTGYTDDWQAGQKQEQAYRRASGGASPTKVDNDTCKCDKSPAKSAPPVIF